MASNSIRCMHQWPAVNGEHYLFQVCYRVPKAKRYQKQRREQAVNLTAIPISISRRSAILISSLPFSLISLSPPSEARERRNKKTIPLEDYVTSR